MPLPYRPHTATVSAVAPTTASRETTAFTRSGSTQVRGMLEENPSTADLEGFGFDVDFPAIWLCNLSDAGSIKVGDFITVNTRVYAVVSGPKKMDAITVIDHASYLVRRHT